jgi:hypothetical protein
MTQKAQKDPQNDFQKSSKPLLPILEFFLTNCTKSFTEIENDFGLSVPEITKSKIKILELEEAEEGDRKPESHRLYNREDEIKSKLYDIKRVEELLDGFDDWVSEDKWNYDISYKEFAAK